MTTLLVPHDVLSPRRPDEHFAEEAAAARDLGLTVALVDHDALCRPDQAAEAVRRVPPTDDAVYRGWMLRSERYAELAVALAGRDVRLRTGAEQYRTAHELPGWLDALAAWTPRSAFSTGAGLDELEEARVRLVERTDAVPGVLRDWTKSLKHAWDEAMFVPDLADPAGVRRVAERFLELRGEDLVGGLVLREFEELAAPEVRTWWTDGECRLFGPHPDDDQPLPPAVLDQAPWDDPGLRDAVRSLRLPFVSVDLARGPEAWRVVELGDGQVSDRPRSVPAQTFVALLQGP